MKAQLQKLLDSFEQQQVAAEILRRFLDFDLPPFSDEELTLNAEEVFLNLDYKESSISNAN